jgi:hypothetical protein
MNFQLLLLDSANRRLHWRRLVRKGSMESKLLEIERHKRSARQYEAEENNTALVEELMGISEDDRESILKLIEGEERKEQSRQELDGSVGFKIDEKVVAVEEDFFSALFDRDPEKRRYAKERILGRKQGDAAIDYCLENQAAELFRADGTVVFRVEHIGRELELFHRFVLSHEPTAGKTCCALAFYLDLTPVSEKYFEDLRAALVQDFFAKECPKDLSRSEIVSEESRAMVEMLQRIIDWAHRNTIASDALVRGHTSPAEVLIISVDGELTWKTMKVPITPISEVSSGVISPTVLHSFSGRDLLMIVLHVNDQASLGINCLGIFAHSMIVIIMEPVRSCGSNQANLVQSAKCVTDARNNNDAVLAANGPSD